jgi:peptide/nickel transport system permease protein
VRLGARTGRFAAGLFTVASLLCVLPARLPGGTEAAFLGARAGDPIARDELRHNLHLSSWPPAQFVHFVAAAAHGDLGFSPVSGVDVGTVVGERTLESGALTLAAIGVAILVSPRRRRRLRSRDDVPAPSAVPGALWALPLVAAVVVAWRFGGIPSVDAHAAIASRCGATLLPAAALGVALAAWLAAARRTARDVLAALIVGTLVTDAVFGLPGLGTLVRDAAT